MTSCLGLTAPSPTIGASRRSEFLKIEPCASGAARRPGGSFVNPGRVGHAPCANCRVRRGARHANPARAARLRPGHGRDPRRAGPAGQPPGISSAEKRRWMKQAIAAMPRNGPTRCPAPAALSLPCRVRTAGQSRDTGWRWMARCTVRCPAFRRSGSQNENCWGGAEDACASADSRINQIP
jgi:hypothetical protein